MVLSQLSRGHRGFSMLPADFFTISCTVDVWNHFFVLILSISTTGTRGKTKVQADISYLRTDLLGKSYSWEIALYQGGAGTAKHFWLVKILFHHFGNILSPTHKENTPCCLGSGCFWLKCIFSLYFLKTMKLFRETLKIFICLLTGKSGMPFFKIYNQSQIRSHHQ